MGKMTGFLEYQRELPGGVHPPSASRTGSKSTSRFPKRSCAAGRALHGLRRAVLPYRLPAQQPDSRLERPGLPRHAGAKRCGSCTRPTTSRSSPAAFVRRRAKRPACSGSRARRSPSSRSKRPSSTAAFEEGWIRPEPPKCRTGKRVAVVGSRPRGTGRRPAIVRAPDTPSRSSKRATASAACCATAFRSSRWRSTSSTAAWNRCAPRA